MGRLFLGVGERFGRSYAFGGRAATSKVMVQYHVANIIKKSEGTLDCILSH